MISVRMILLLCLIVACLQFNGVSADSCFPAEEGTSHNFSCTFNASAIGPYLTWSTVNSNITKTVANCSFGGCNAEHGFKATALGDTATLTILNVSRHHQPLNFETKLRCGDTKFVCNPILVYAKPKDVRCEFPPVNSSSDHVVITCTADRIYPKASCIVYISKDNKTFQSLSTTNSYKHAQFNETPVYYTSECRSLVYLRHFLTGNNFIKIKMYPEVTGGSKYGVDSETYLMSLNIQLAMDSSTTESDPSNALSSAYLVIGLGTACACAVCAVTVLIILVLRYKRKSKGEKQHTQEMSSMKMPQEVPLGYDIAGKSAKDEDTCSEVYEEVQNAFSPSRLGKSGENKNNVYGNVE